MAAGALVNIVAYVADPSNEGAKFEDKKWEAPVSVEEVAKQYAGWEPQVQAIVQVSEPPVC